MLEDGRLVGCVDILETAADAAYRFLSSRKDEAYRKHGRNFAIRIDVQEVDDKGILRLVLNGDIPKSLEEESSFSVEEKFQLRKGNEGPFLKLLGISYAPGS